MSELLADLEDELCGSKAGAQKGEAFQNPDVKVQESERMQDADADAGAHGNARPGICSKCAASEEREIGDEQEWKTSVSAEVEVVEEENAEEVAGKEEAVPEPAKEVRDIEVDATTPVVPPKVLEEKAVQTEVVEVEAERSASPEISVRTREEIEEERPLDIQIRPDELRRLVLEFRRFVSL